VDDSETNPRQSIEFLPLRTKPFAGQTERVLKQPTATIVAKPRDMHHCGWHDITRHHLVPNAFGVRMLQWPWPSSNASMKSHTVKTEI